ncbi:hypothetical protein EV175_000079 [Coemansia sp. RSA 1933]|nr:hypothetical protein EV175_000079 [Coemansia sp. RSA 1933]
MNISHTATIGRSQRGLDTMRDLQAMLAQTSTDDTTTTTTEPEEPNSKRTADDAAETGSSSDVDDIDSETATNTIYNLLNELGDLNRCNRRTAEILAEKFSTLQTRVSRAEDDVARGAAASGESVHQPSLNGITMQPNEPLLPDSNPEPAQVLKNDVQTQTLQGFADLDATAERMHALESENTTLRTNVQILVSSLKEQQLMAKEYESTLAKTLSALRSAAFERHLEISDVQARYRELLESEKLLNERLLSENVDLKHALGNAAAAIRLSLAATDSETMMPVGHSTPSDDSDATSNGPGDIIDPMGHV